MTDVAKVANVRQSDMAVLVLLMGTLGWLQFVPFCNFYRADITPCAPEFAHQLILTKISIWLVLILGHIERTVQ